MERMKEKCNWRGIGSLVVITVCLVSVMSPVMTQSSLSMFGNISDGTNGETGDDSIPTPTPPLTPTPDPTSNPSPTPTQGPTPTLTPTPSPTPTLTPPPTQVLSSNEKLTTPFMIYGFVSYKNGSACDAPFVVVTILNTASKTSKEFIADNRTGVSFYQLVTSSAFVNASEVLQINASKNGTLIGNATHTVNQTEIEQGIIEVNINEGMPDLTVSAISTPPLIKNETNTIKVIIRNNGTASSGAFNVTFYVNTCGNETEYENETRIPSLERDSHVSTNFTWKPFAKGCYNITVSADSDYEINESNESNNNLTMTVFVGAPDFTITNVTFNPSEPVIEDVVKISAAISNIGVKNDTTFVEFYDNKSIEIKRAENDYSGRKSINDTFTLPGVRKIKVHFSHIGAFSDIKIYDKYNSEIEKFEFPSNDITDYWTKWCDGDTIRIESLFAEFSVDRYEAVLANESVSLSAGNSTNISANWNLSLQEFGWATSGEHNITVKVDPYNQIVESNEENNMNETEILVRPSLDFAVTNISFNPPKPLLYDVIAINATAKNFGVRNGTTIVKVYYDNRSIANETISLNATESTIVNASLNVTAAGYHNISVKMDPHNVSTETNKTNNTLTKQIFVNGTDLAVINIAIPCGQSFENPCYCGHAVNITTTIANLGALSSSNFTILFKDGLGEWNNSEDISPFNTTNIPPLDAGNSTNITVPWNISAGLDYHTITVNIPFDNTDNNKTNNRLSKHVVVSSEWDFSVEDVNVVPERVSEGELVNITATIGNLGIKSGNVTVGFYVNSTDFVGSGDERFFRINTTDVYVNKTNITSITWNANTTGGDHAIFAVADPDEKISEVEDIKKKGNSILFRGDISGTGNNVNSSTLHVIPLKLNITNLSLVPAQPVVGDKVNVTAVVKNEETGSEHANSTVWFYMEKNLSIKDDIRSEDDEKGDQHWNCSLSQPEYLPIRIHFDYIRINNFFGYAGFGSVDDYVSAYVDSQPVYFYVKNKDVANGQPIKVRKIDFNSQCAYCSIEHTEPGECREKKWEDVWTDWSEGNTLVVEVIAPGRVNLKLKIDKYQVRLGNKTVTLNAGESTPYNVMWTASPLKLQEFKDWKLHDEKMLTGENYNYTFVANVEERVERTETYLSGTDLAVDFSLTETCFDGDEVNFTATITNTGSKNAANFTVNFTEVYVPTGKPPKPWDKEWIESYNNSKRINTTHVSGLEAGNITNISVAWNASIQNIRCTGKCDAVVPEGECSWIETAENYMIKVEIIPLHYFDYNMVNNVLEREVRLKRARDFEVSNLEFIVNNNETRSPDSYGKVNLELELGENVTLNTTLNITNLANRGGVVNVSFYIDEVNPGHEFGIYSTNFTAANETKSVKWNFDEVNIAGDHNIIVVVDPGNKIHEINESNNEYIQQIHVKAPELTFINLTFDPEKEMVNKSENINITAKVANYGDKNATNVSLGIYDWTDRHIEDVDVKAYSGLERMEIERENATAMRLYLDLKIDRGGEVCIKDSYGKQEKCYYDNFHGWTPWVLDNNITVVTNGSAHAKVSKVYYLKSCDPFNTTTLHNLSINETKAIPPVKWTVSSVGERLIAAIIDPENMIPEYDESNNTKAEYLTVQTADLEVSNLTLKWQNNGIEIGENDTIKHGDIINITANVTNIGVDKASNFDLRILVDGVLIPGGAISNLNLTPNESIQVFAIWNVAVGDEIIKVEADYEDVIIETNETNNIAAEERYICGVGLSGNTIWKTSGLNEIVLFNDTTQPYDEDEEVNITVNTTNSGCLNAINFSVVMFYDYKPYTYHKHCNDPGTKREWSYDNAVCIYLDIDITRYQVLAIYDGNGTEVKRTDKSCWVHVPGDTVKLAECIDWRDLVSEYTISFYPVYKTNLTRIDRLDNKSSTNVPMERIENVTVGNYTVTVFIDPENKVPEDDKTDNIVTRVMEVLPTRDFTVTKVIPEWTNISDVDTLTITANVSNVGYRNGTTRVDFVDYENETRIHKYYLYKTGKNLTYLPVLPDEILPGPRSYNRNLTIIHRPGVDAIKLNFSWKLYAAGRNEQYNESIPRGEIMIRNDTGGEVWNAKYGEEEPELLDWVEGETIYVNLTNAYFNLRGYTTVKEFYNREENVTLNASVSWDECGNITAWSESKNITTRWNASAGDHNITVIADRDDEIDEINELNNTFNLPLKVNATRDPAIVELNIIPMHPNDGDNVTITAVVRNEGTENASFVADLWADTTRRLFTTDSVPEDANWSIPVEDKIRYVRLLNHTNVSLAPGENETITAIWENISIYGDPTYIVRAIVDPLDAIDELNESNNEASPEIIMNASDLTVVGFNSPTEQKNNASVIIENRGAIGASNVTVRFELCKREKTDITESGSNYSVLSQPGAANIRVHFAEINAPDGWVEIKKSLSVDEPPIKSYGGDVFRNVWTPWVKGDTVFVCYSNAIFTIDEYIWGDVEDRVIEYLNGSESVNVSLPWQEYRRPERLNVTVDPDNNETEQREDNNNGTTLIYIDLVLKGVEIDGNWIKATVWSDATLEGGMAFPPTCDFKVSCSRFFIHEIINKSFYGWDVEEKWFDIEKGDFDANRKYNLLLEADSGDVIDEMDETNNNGSLWIGPHIVLESVGVVPSYPLMGRKCFFNMTINNTGEIGTGEFNVWVNISNETFNYTKSFDKRISLARREDKPLSFEWIPPELSPPVDREYNYIVTADPEREVNELNPSKEEKTKSGSKKVFNYTGYAGGRWLVPAPGTPGEVNGDVIFTVGTSYYLGQSPQAIYEVDFGNLLPSDVNPGGVKFARLYLYWLWSKDLNTGVPVKPVVNVWFNTVDISDISQNMDNREYEDNPHATVPGYDRDYGVYCYDVRSHVETNNTARVERISPFSGDYTFGIDAIGLLVAYENGSTLTKYWVDEGADILMARMNVTGLHWNECETYANFADVDTDRGIATLITVVPWGAGDEDGNMLRFEGRSTRGWENIWDGTVYGEEYDGENLAVNATDVTSLFSVNNDIVFQDRGDFMMPTNAFLVVRYPPELKPDDLPSSVGVGKSIPVAIRNTGRSDAKDFNVSFYVDGVFKGKIEHVNVEAGKSTPVTFPWKPLAVGQIVRLNVSVDCDTDVQELDENNNNISQLVLVDPRTQLAHGGESISPWKEGLGPGEGPGEGAGAGTTAGEGGKSAMGEKGGKAITGRLMKGTVAQSEEAGGGKLEFSILGLLMRLAVLAVAVVLVCAGYLLERRRQEHKQ